MGSQSSSVISIADAQMEENKKGFFTSFLNDNSKKIQKIDNNMIDHIYSNIIIINKSQRITSKYWNNNEIFVAAFTLYDTKIPENTWTVHFFKNIKFLVLNLQKRVFKSIFDFMNSSLYPVKCKDILSKILSKTIEIQETSSPKYRFKLEKINTASSNKNLNPNNSLKKHRSRRSALDTSSPPHKKSKSKINNPVHLEIPRMIITQPLSITDSETEPNAKAAQGKYIKKGTKRLTLSFSPEKTRKKTRSSSASHSNSKENPDSEKHIKRRSRSETAQRHLHENENSPQSVRKHKRSVQLHIQKSPSFQKFSSCYEMNPNDSNNHSNKKGKNLTPEKKNEVRKRRSRSAGNKTVFSNNSKETSTISKSNIEKTNRSSSVNTQSKHNPVNLDEFLSKLNQLNEVHYFLEKKGHIDNSIKLKISDEQAINVSKSNEKSARKKIRIKKRKVRLDKTITKENPPIKKFSNFRNDANAFASEVAFLSSSSSDGNQKKYFDIPRTMNEKIQPRKSSHIKKSRNKVLKLDYKNKENKIVNKAPDSNIKNQSNSDNSSYYSIPESSKQKVIEFTKYVDAQNTAKGNDSNQEVKSKEQRRIQLLVPPPPSSNATNNNNPNEVNVKLAQSNHISKISSSQLVFRKRSLSNFLFPSVLPDRELYTPMNSIDSNSKTAKTSSDNSSSHSSYSNSSSKQINTPSFISGIKMNENFKIVSRNPLSQNKRGNSTPHQKRVYHESINQSNIKLVDNSSSSLKNSSSRLKRKNRSTPYNDSSKHWEFNNSEIGKNLTNPEKRTDKSQSWKLILNNSNQRSLSSKSNTKIRSTSPNFHQNNSILHPNTYKKDIHPSTEEKQHSNPHSTQPPASSNHNNSNSNINYNINRHSRGESVRASRKKKENQKRELLNPIINKPPSRQRNMYDKDDNVQISTRKYTKRGESAHSYSYHHTKNDSILIRDRFSENSPESYKRLKFDDE